MVASGSCLSSRLHATARLARGPACKHTRPTYTSRYRKREEKTSRVWWGREPAKTLLERVWVGWNGWGGVGWLWGMRVCTMGTGNDVEFKPRRDAMLA